MMYKHKKDNISVLIFFKNCPERVSGKVKSCQTSSKYKKRSKLIVVEFYDKKLFVDYTKST